MSNPPFKRLDVVDIFREDQTATFERPHEDNDIVVVNIGDKDFHLHAATLKTIGDVMIDKLKNPHEKTN